MTYCPFRVEGEGRQSRFLITCDHATNTVPPELGGTLGLSDGDMARHIAYDVGAAGVARALGAALGAPVVLSEFSRLVIDPNRGEDDPTLLMKLYDGSVIPANRHADAAEKARRIETYHRPYHRALEGLAARREDVAIVSVHSFTRQLRGRPTRPWHVGVLHAWDARLSNPLIALLQAEPDLVIGRNEPYPRPSARRCHRPPRAEARAAEHAAGGPQRPDRNRNRAGALGGTACQPSDPRAGAGPGLSGTTGRPAHPGAQNHQTTHQGGRTMDDQTRTELEAAAFRRLRQHLMQDRPEVQNIDLMNLAGFCRNCLSRWYQEAANERGLEMGKEDAREIFYGMPYDDWKAAQQTEAGPEKQAAFDKAFKENVTDKG
ncbi:DUF1244 domain-containing protein [Ponticoccus gilvus]|nr:DUF1244 domain-containing protein [Enemella evansiae]